LNAAKRHEIFRRLQAANPEPRSDLQYSSPFELLVAVVLSAQATDRGVNQATAKLFPVANTPAAIAALGVEGLETHIRTIGLFRTKAKNVIALCGLLLEHHGGEVPRDRDSLQALPGVGRKTANVVMNIAFGEPTIAVDTHIFRIANRTGLYVVSDEIYEDIVLEGGHVSAAAPVPAERGEDAGAGHRSGRAAGPRHGDLSRVARV
jgi:endonuclease-3